MKVGKKIRIQMLVKRLLVIFLVISMLTLQLGCEYETESSTEEGYFYEFPEEALSDIDDDSLKEELEERGYSVYSDPTEALEDLDDYSLIEELDARGYQVEE